MWALAEILKAVSSRYPILPVILVPALVSEMLKAIQMSIAVKNVQSGQ